MLQRRLLQASMGGSRAWRAFCSTSSPEFVFEHHHVKDSHLKEVYPPPAHFKQHAHIKSLEEYQRMYRQSIDDPAGFWGAIGDSFTWHKKWDKVLDWEFTTPSIKWFDGGELNITVNCLDRHVLNGFGARPAVTFEGDDGSSVTYSFQQLLDNVSATCRVLEAHGVKKGDRVSLCMPMVPQLLFSMLACARMGAVHCAIFAGFSAESVAERITNAKSDVVIASESGLRGGKVVPLKQIVDAALDIAEKRGLPVRRVLVASGRGMYSAGSTTASWKEGRDVSLDAELEDVHRNTVGKGLPIYYPATPVDSEHPLFILYTSGSTGAPKGVLHTTAGYMAWAATTFKYIFDTRPSAAHYPVEGAKKSKAAARDAVKPDLHFCTADIGWVTGHTYLCYGPLLNGTHTLLFEGTPTYPGPDRLWDVVEKHKATTLYTAPTAIRALMVHGDAPVRKHDTSSLRLLGSVGEPINPEAWRWYHSVVGRGKLPIVDTWWQTETGGIMITSLPGATNMKPGIATKPFFGVDAKVVNQDGSECGPNEGGFLVIDKPWPGMMRTVYGDHTRFHKTYFSQMPGRYFTGDGAVRDADGDIQILGRTDDVINVSGHRLGTAEVEAALALHRDVVEAAVVGFPHPIKGEGIYAFITLRHGAVYTQQLQQELAGFVRKQIGPIATPDVLHPTPDLPKTRSGKIMRRILRKIAAGDVEPSGFGDTSTLSDPSIVQALIAGRHSTKPTATSK